MNMGERIKKIRGKESRKLFAEKFEIHPNTLARWESGEREPDIGFIIKIIKEFNLTPEWVIFGENKTIQGANNKGEEKEDSFGLIKKAVEILESNTGYKKALAGSIEAIYCSMKEDIIKEAKIKTKVDEVKRENHDLKMQCLACENKDEVQQTA